MVPRRSSSRRLLILAFAVVVAAVAAVSIALASGGNRHGADTSNRVTAAQLSDPDTPGKVLFASNFEQADFPEWYVQALPGRVRLVHGTPYEGRSNARFEVRPGDVEPNTGSSRAEVSGPNFYQGQDVYVRTAFRVPDANSFRGPWQLIQQFHENESDGGSPGTAVFLTSDRRLRIGAGDSSQIDWTSAPLRVDHWYELVYRVKFSQDDSTGFVEVWLDGRRQRLASGHFREYGHTMNEPSVYLKTGIYRAHESTGVSVVEDDSVIVIERSH